MRAALAKGDMVVRVPGHVERVRVRKDLLVPVAGCEPHDDLVAQLDLLTTQLDVARRRTAEVVDRRGPAEHLLDSGGDELGLLLEERHLVGVLDQGQHRVADRVPCGLVAGDHQQQEVVVEVGGRQGFAVLGHPVHQLADEVLAVTPTPLSSQLTAVLEDLEGSG